jgi:ferredoxin
MTQDNQTTPVYQVEFQHEGQVTTVPIAADQIILKAAVAAGLDLPSSCNAGVCTTCAAKILAGEVHRGDSMGLGPNLQEQGYVLLCTAYPRSDLKILTGQEDTVYDIQFGVAQS